MIVEGEGLFLALVSCSAWTKISECTVITCESSPSTATECFCYSTILEHCVRVELKYNTEWRRKQNINKKKCQIATSLYSILLSKEEEEERKGHTLVHVVDTGCIPLGEITVEHKGIVKRYTKETKR